MYRPSAHATPHTFQPDQVAVVDLLVLASSRNSNRRTGGVGVVS